MAQRRGPAQATGRIQNQRRRGGGGSLLTGNGRSGRWLSRSAGVALACQLTQVGFLERRQAQREAVQIQNQPCRLAGVFSLTGHIHPDDVALAVLAPLVGSRIDLFVHDALPARCILKRGNA